MTFYGRSSVFEPEKDERELELEEEEEMFDYIRHSDVSGYFGEVAKNGHGTHTQDWIQVKTETTLDQENLLQKRPWVVIMKHETIYVTLEKWCPDPYHAKHYFWARVSILPHSKYHLKDLVDFPIHCHAEGVCQTMDRLVPMHSLPEKVIEEIHLMRVRKVI